MEDFHSHMWLEMCSRWFHLADYTTLYHEVEDFFNNIVMSTNGLRVYNRNGLIDPMIPVKEGMITEPMIFEDRDRRVVTDRYIKPDLNAWREFRNAATVNPNQSF